MTGLLVVLVSAGCLGAGVCRYLPGQDRFARYSLAWGTGLGLLGYAASFLAWMGVSLSPYVVLAVCLAAAVTGVALWRSAGANPEQAMEPPGDWRGLSPLEQAVAVVAAGLALAILVTILTTPVKAFDARMIWMFHARLIAGTGTHPAPELHDPAFVIGHPQYPPLLPMLQALVAILSGVFDERGVRLIPAGFYFATTALLWSGLKGVPGRHLLAGAYALMPTLVVFEEGGADSGLADVMLSFFMLAALSLSLTGGRELLRFAVAGACAALAGLVKNEGLVLSGMVAVVLWTRSGIPLRSKVVFTAIWLGMLFPWFGVRREIATLFEERYLDHLEPGRLLWGLHRAGLVAGEMGRQMFLMPQRAGLFWWLVLVWFAASADRRERFLACGFWIVPAYLAVVYILYLVTPWENDFQVRLSFSRVLLHVAPLALWAAALPPHRRG